jgi:hypothetical protein
MYLFYAKQLLDMKEKQQQKLVFKNSFACYCMQTIQTWTRKYSTKF